MRPSALFLLNSWRWLVAGGFDQLIQQRSDQLVSPLPQERILFERQTNRSQVVNVDACRIVTAQAAQRPQCCKALFNREQCFLLVTGENVVRTWRESN
jgi:hypothetical protein